VAIEVHEWLHSAIKQQITQWGKKIQNLQKIAHFMARILWEL
jgi:hypothetical protein